MEYGCAIAKLLGQHALIYAQPNFIDTRQRKIRKTLTKLISNADIAAQ